MRRVTSLERLEEVIGATPLAIRMKTITSLDDGCRQVLAHSPIAWFGFRDMDGLPYTTLVGGPPGFTRFESPTAISFRMPDEGHVPAPKTGVSFVFLLPRIGETLRVTGTVTGISGLEVSVQVREAWIHCAKCILRSKLWSSWDSPGSTPHNGSSPSGAAALAGPLAQGEVVEFLTSSHFLGISSWDSRGFSDTSPKGDPPGFVRILDDHTLALPDRKGNLRTDTFHNLLECDELSLAAIVPGGDEILHLRGTGFVTDEPELLATMALGEKPPKASLVIDVHHVETAPNAAISDAKLWDASEWPDMSGVPDLMRLGAQHLAKNREPGTKASVTRTLSRGMTAAPKLLRKAIDVAYQKDLEKEGYTHVGPIERQDG